MSPEDQREVEVAREEACQARALLLEIRELERQQSHLSISIAECWGKLRGRLHMIQRVCRLGESWLREFLKVYPDADAMAQDLMRLSRSAR